MQCLNPPPGHTVYFVYAVNIASHLGLMSLINNGRVHADAVSVLSRGTKEALGDQPARSGTC